MTPRTVNRIVKSTQIAGAVILTLCAVAEMVWGNYGFGCVWAVLANVIIWTL